MAKVEWGAMVKVGVAIVDIAQFASNFGPIAWVPRLVVVAA